MDQNSAMSFAVPYCIPMQNNVMPRNTINKSLCQEFYFFIDKIPLFFKVSVRHAMERTRQVLFVSNISFLLRILVTLQGSKDMPAGWYNLSTSPVELI